MENKQFKMWLINNIENMNLLAVLGVTNSKAPMTKTFTELPFSMKWGVYLEFFDSIGINIESTIDDYSDAFKYGWLIQHKEKTINHGREISLKESQQEAVKKTFEFLMLSELSDKGKKASKAGTDLRNKYLEEE